MIVMPDPANHKVNTFIAGVGLEQVGEKGFESQKKSTILVKEQLQVSEDAGDTIGCVIMDKYSTRN